MAEENQKTNMDQSGVSINLNPEPEGAQKLYSSDDPSNDQVDLAKAGFDLGIKQERPEDVLQNDQENVVDSIVKQATLDKAEEQKILNELETMDPGLSSDLPVAPIAEQNTKNAKKIFIAIFLIATLAVSYFYVAQKGFPLLGFEPDTKLQEAEVQLTGIKHQSVISDLMSASVEYRNFAYLGGLFSIESQNKRLGRFTRQTVSQTDIKESAQNLKKHLEVISKQMNDNPEFRVSVLTAVVDESKKVDNKIKSTEDTAQKASLLLDKALLKESQRLAKEITKDNSEFVKALDQIIADEYTDQEMLNKLDALYEGNSFNEYAKVAHIQESRVNWTEVINEIERVTQSIDPAFTIDGSVSGEGISYSAFSFNRDNSRVNITGQTRTSDIKTFTLIADLTDAFEESPMFSIHDSRTYSKQKDEDDGYKASITLDVILESKES